MLFAQLQSNAALTSISFIVGNVFVTPLVVLEQNIHFPGSSFQQPSQVIPQAVEFRFRFDAVLYLVTPSPTKIG